MPKEQFKKFWNLAPEASNPDIVNMYIYGEICSCSSWWWGDDSDVVTSEFIKDLNKYPDASTINVFINSPGGEVYAAAAIRNQLRQHKATIHTYGDGIIASAAVGLLGAASPGCRHMSKSALIMVHDPLTRVQGNVKALEKGIEVLTKVKSTILNIYEEDTGLDRAQLEQMMADETYLEAYEAKELGFIDTITEEEDAEVSITNADTFTYNGVMGSFKNFAHPEKLKSKLQSLAKSQKSEGGQTMDFKDIMNALSEDQQAVVRNHMSAAIAEASNKAVEAQQQVWDSAKKELESQIDSLKAQIPTPQAKSPEDALLDSLPEEARQLVLQARADAAEAQAKLDAAEEQKNFSAFKDSLSVFNALPITDEQVNGLYALKQADEANYNNVVNLLTVANNAMDQKCEPVGSDTGVPQATTAYDEIEGLIANLRNEDSSLSYNDAFKRVVTDNPALYDRYRAEK